MKILIVEDDTLLHSAQYSRPANRDGGDLPVLPLTARDALDDRVQGPDAGADPPLSGP
nr:Transcriptional regulatory protein BasR [Candidatus Pantoea persica]